MMTWHGAKQKSLRNKLNDDIEDRMRDDPTYYGLLPRTRPRTVVVSIPFQTFHGPHTYAAHVL